MSLFWTLHDCCAGGVDVNCKWALPQHAGCGTLCSCKGQAVKLNGDTQEHGAEGRNSQGAVLRGASAALELPGLVRSGTCGAVQRQNESKQVCFLWRTLPHSRLCMAPRPRRQIARAAVWSWTRERSNREWESSCHH